VLKMTKISDDKVIPIRPDIRPITHCAKPIAKGVRLISGGNLTPEKFFRHIYGQAMIARAERELVEARWSYIFHTEGGDAAEHLGDERDLAFNRLRSAIVALAFTPAMNRMQVAQKIRGIGGAWMKAEGSFYDRLRFEVGRDESRLGIRSPRTIITSKALAK